jgi:hypothetical protein
MFFSKTVDFFLKKTTFFSPKNHCNPFQSKQKLRFKQKKKDFKLIQNDKEGGGFPSNPNEFLNELVAEQSDQ